MDINFSMRNVIYVVVFLVIAAVLIVIVLPRLAPDVINKTLYNFGKEILIIRGGG
jgi:hypothetical protein